MTYKIDGKNARLLYTSEKHVLVFDAKWERYVMSLPCYLEAGENGLCGIVAVGKRAIKSERNAA